MARTVTRAASPFTSEATGILDGQGIVGVSEDGAESWHNSGEGLYGKSTE